MQIKTKNNIIGWVVSFIISIGCVGFLVAVLSFHTVFSYDYALRGAEKVSYIEGTRDEIQKQFLMLAMPSDDPEEANIPVDVMEDFFAKFDMIPDIENAIAQAYGKGEFSTERMEKAMAEHLIAYAERIQVEHLDEVKESMGETTALFAEEYTAVCNNALLEYFGFYRAGILQFLIIAAVFCGAIFIFGCGFLWWLFWKERRNTFFYMMYNAIFPSALILLPLGIYLGMSDFLYRLSINPKYVRDFIAFIGSGLFMDILYTGVVLLVLSVACFCVYRFWKFGVNSQNKSVNNV